MVFQLFSHGVFNRKERRDKNAESPELDIIFISARHADLIQHPFDLSIKDPETSTIDILLKKNRHLDCSEAKWRDL